MGLLPENGAGKYYTYDQYYTWLTSEYLADDLSEVVRSQVFAQDVSKRLGNTVPAGVIQGATNPQKTHRILTVSITTGSAEQSMAIAGAAAAALQEQGDKYFAQVNAAQRRHPRPGPAGPGPPVRRPPRAAGPAPAPPAGPGRRRRPGLPRRLPGRLRALRRRAGGDGPGRGGGDPAVGRTPAAALSGRPSRSPRPANEAGAPAFSSGGVPSEALAMPIDRRTGLESLEFYSKDGTLSTEQHAFLRAICHIRLGEYGRANDALLNVPARHADVEDVLRRQDHRAVLVGRGQGGPGSEYLRSVRTARLVSRCGASVVSLSAQPGPPGGVGAYR